ncbi:MAG: VCBS repeat-containing protein [Candidatus Zixiibacteriota bacterium]|nr:MAG: VCBS repeat-containing protein [candidate division Zixibacteria bacterium]
MRLMIACFSGAIGVGVIAGPAYSQVINAPTNYSVGLAPRSIATEDFDGDGFDDLVTANANSNNVSILFGNGDGTFGTAVNYDAGTQPSSVAAGDLDNDSQIDLAVTNFESDDVSILKNNGIGVFAAPQNYPTGVSGASPRSVCIVELDGAGLPDLAVANVDADSIAVLINNGDGTFPAPVTYGLGIGTSPYSIVSADFDGDMWNDLAVANSGTGDISVLINNQDGTFAVPVTYTVGSNPRAVATADFDGLSGSDLAVANFSEHDVSILDNNGDGTLGARLDYPAGSAPRGLCLVDLNGDLSIDIAVANFTSGDVSILLNNGDGTFATAVNYLVGSGPTSVCSADFDDDGDNDLAVTNINDNSVSVLLNGTDILVAVEDEASMGLVPATSHLGQNYPNPFNPTTSIAFSLATRSRVVIAVYNMIGQQVGRLADREFEAGDHTIGWDGRDETGQLLPTGVYLYRLQAGDFVATRKMLLLK